MKFRPVGAELSHADGQKDMTKLILALRNFANISNTDGMCLDGLHQWWANIFRRGPKKMAGHNDLL